MFYKNLHALKIKVQEKHIQEFFTHTKVPELDDIEKIMCDRPIQMTEIVSALKELKNDKSPGNDGFPQTSISFLLLDTYKCCIKLDHSRLESFFGG